MAVVEERPITEAREDLATLTNRVAYGNDRFVLTRRGRGLAAVVSMQDLELLRALEDRINLAEARQALRNPKNRGERVSWEELASELGLQ